MSGSRPLDVVRAGHPVRWHFLNLDLLIHRLSRTR
jgi:hypothetical protein